MVYLSYTRIPDLGKRDSSLTSNTNDAQTPYAYDEIAHVQMPPGYADHPEDERIFPSLTLTNDSSFGDLLLLALSISLHYHFHTTSISISQSYLYSFQFIFYRCMNNTKVVNNCY